MTIPVTITKSGGYYSAETSTLNFLFESARYYKIRDVWYAYVAAFGTAKYEGYGDWTGTYHQCDTKAEAEKTLLNTMQEVYQKFFSLLHTDITVELILKN